LTTLLFGLSKPVLRFAHALNKISNGAQLFIAYGGCELCTEPGVCIHLGKPKSLAGEIGRFDLNKFKIQYLVEFSRIN